MDSTKAIIANDRVIDVDKIKTYCLSSMNHSTTAISSKCCLFQFRSLRQILCIKQQFAIYKTSNIKNFIVPIICK